MKDEPALNQRTSLKVVKSLGEAALSAARELGILDRKSKIESTDTEVIIPLARPPSKKELASLKSRLTSLQISNHSFRCRKLRPSNLLEAVGHRLPSHLLGALPHSYDIIGNIAIVELPENLLAHGHIIGEALMRLNPRVKTVMTKAGPVTNTFRLRSYASLAGEQSTLTQYSESGCVFQLDPRKAYFSPRLSYERRRIASKVQRGEVVVDMFAGVGPFSIIAAKLGKARVVYGVDINPEAVSFMLQNVVINRLRGRITVVLADVQGTSVGLLSHSADRVIMNLPLESLAFIPRACNLLKREGGIIHFYAFVSDKFSREALLEIFKEKIESASRNIVGIEAIRIVKGIAPREWQLAIDVRIA
jgi:tRNA (guanine37-N1)-methyltransferase